MNPATARLKSFIGADRPVIAIVLGSSLGALADRLEKPRTLNYAELPGFPLPTVTSHAGEMVAGTFGGKSVLVLKGRAHPYEKGNAAAMRPAIEALHECGVSKLLLTNAAGSCRPEVGPGRLMLITDHINLSGLNPLFGEMGDQRFVSLTNAYDPALAEAMRAAARAERIDLTEGVYAWFSGPSFESPAEIRMAQIIGAQAVGMSTAQETILARFFGQKVVAMSVLTNLAAGIGGASPSHEETYREGSKAAGNATRLIERFVRDLSAD